MRTRFLRVALTGGIATGKSHCLRTLAAIGAPVIDADVLAREVVLPGTRGLAAVRHRFGPSVVLSDGTLNRDALGQIVFGDPTARRDLEAIVHPEIYSRIKEWFVEQAARSQAAAIADVPLLYETDRHGDFDRVIVAACSPAEQLERLMARDGSTETAARQRIGAQMPIDDKRARADMVIDTSGTLEHTDRQVVEVWERLTREAAGRE